MTFATTLDEVLALRSALAPFASIDIPPSAPDDGVVVVTALNGGIIDTGPKCRVKIADIRRARAILKE